MKQFKDLCWLKKKWLVLVGDVHKCRVRKSGDGYCLEYYAHSLWSDSKEWMFENRYSTLKEAVIAGEEYMQLQYERSQVLWKAP